MKGHDIYEQGKCQSDKGLCHCLSQDILKLVHLLRRLHVS
jgi:hypothetical protein